ncbi:Transcription elongation factor GreA [Patulibacter medicamentivorans]|uniref:Transcription elongation factor GreA n=1 Tax=Patulibacter medicamentivorans TaxID=1097667 RepID=H0E4K3_9ACTN|nr:transcription elongation factor GreA [Patulibacter medicamentivorans]EHN11374.1 Transcription elongation factor GreA [Patulibacter medicamentivorans]
MSTAGESISPEGLEALKAELAELEGPARRDIAARIQRARELGDLKENAEYHQAKDDQAHLETRIAILAERRRNAVVTEVSTDASVVGFGSTVTLVDTDSGKSQTWTLVGAAEADVSAGKLSIESPVAGAVMGRKIGDVVVVQTPRGARNLRVDAIGA